ncbi:hypothetical protein BN2537_9071 [Streptomyces venezuelae]|nr:hypothetical protein BN2537_9071 [Streptomyces venezuelae]
MWGPFRTCGEHGEHGGQTMRGGRAVRVGPVFRRRRTLPAGSFRATGDSARRSMEG